MPGGRGQYPSPSLSSRTPVFSWCLPIDRPNRKPEGQVAVDTVHTGQPPRAQSRAEGEWTWRREWNIPSKAMFIIRLGHLMLPLYNGICHIKHSK